MTTDQKLTTQILLFTILFTPLLCSCSRYMTVHSSTPTNGVRVAIQTPSFREGAAVYYYRCSGKISTPETCILGYQGTRDRRPHFTVHAINGVICVAEDNTPSELLLMQAIDSNTLFLWYEIEDGRTDGSWTNMLARVNSGSSMVYSIKRYKSDAQLQVIN